MNAFRSDWAPQLVRFIAWRKASGIWNKTDEDRLTAFDRYCAECAGFSALTQEIVDGWCQRRNTETNRSCQARISVVIDFVKYLDDRGLADISPPHVPKTSLSNSHIPHAFTERELTAFFKECDSIIPIKGRMDTVVRKIQCPVLFRLLYSSGIRTTEARYLKRTDVDLEHGVLRIQKSKGHDQHYVALHETMTDLLKRYDEAIDKIQPNRQYFFESYKTGRYYEREWISRNFKILWEAANGHVI